VPTLSDVAGSAVDGEGAAEMPAAAVVSATGLAVDAVAESSAPPPSSDPQAAMIDVNAAAAAANLTKRPDT
jgi:hypothetical protein